MRRQMRRIDPDSSLWGLPCSICAVASALGYIPEGTEEYKKNLKDDGYATLNAANRYIRDNLDIAKRTDYKRGQRPMLKNLHLDGKAVVCVYGHLIFVDHESYWSFFENEDDDVVAVWRLK